MHEEAWYDDPRYWVALAFVLFVVVFVRYLLPKLVEALDARSRQIADQLEQAASLRKEAEALLAEYKQKQAHMLKEAEALVQATQGEVARMKERAEQDIATSIARRKAQAEANITQMEEAARNEIRDKLIEVATASARELMTKELSGAKEDPSVAQVISQIQRNLH